MTETASMERIHTQILWNRLLAVVEEQAQTLMRTAFSTTVREAGDLSAGVFDTRGRMLAQAVTGTPGHVNAMAASVGFFLNRFPLGNLKPGDVLLTNDPWYGTGHLNDFTVVTPVFKDAVAVALFAATSHIADVGGLGFGPDGRQVFEEGLNIPMGYLFRAGEANETLLEIIRANVRDPRAAEGDPGTSNILNLKRDMFHDMSHPGAIILGQTTNKTARFAIGTTVLLQTGQRLLQTIGKFLATFDRWPVDQHTDIEHHANHREVCVNAGSYINVGCGYFHLRVLVFLGG